MGTGNRHINIRGRDAILSKDIELKNYVLSEYMSGKSITQIAKDIIIKFPEKPPISRVTISRFINQHLDELDVDESCSDSAIKELIQAFQDTKDNFNQLFDELREELDLSPKQIEMVDKMQRKCNLSLNNCKTKWKLFIISTRQTNTELQGLLGKFVNTLDWDQKQSLSKLLDEMWPEELLTDKDMNKYRKFQAKKVKLFYKMFPQHENSEVQ